MMGPLGRKLAAWLGAALFAAAPCLAQQSSDPNLAHPNRVVTAARDGYTIAGLVTHLEGAASFKHGIALFPGSPGVIRLVEENGRISHLQVGNFLIRSRRHWLDPDLLLVVVDAPTDQWHFFNQRFRETPRYGEDVRALVTEVGRLFGGIADWTFIGTSEGTVSAFHAARMNPGLARRVILSASMFQASKNGPGLAPVDWSALKPALLFVHHEDDPCPYTQYGDARRYSEQTRSPLITVRGGGPTTSSPCEARSPHGFVGVERETVLAMRAWVKGGAAPLVVTPGSY